MSFGASRVCLLKEWPHYLTPLLHNWSCTAITQQCCTLISVYKAWNLRFGRFHDVTYELHLCTAAASLPGEKCCRVWFMSHAELLSSCCCNSLTFTRCSRNMCVSFRPSSQTEEIWVWMLSWGFRYLWAGILLTADYSKNDWVVVIVVTSISSVYDRCVIVLRLTAALLCSAVH